MNANGNLESRNGQENLQEEAEEAERKEESGTACRQNTKDENPKEERVNMIRACQKNQKQLRADMRKRPVLPGTSAIKLAGARSKGLLSPALSSRGGEGDGTANSFDKSPDSMAAVLAVRLLKRTK